MSIWNNLWVSRNHLFVFQYKQYYLSALSELFQTIGLYFAFWLNILNAELRYISPYTCMFIMFRLMKNADLECFYQMHGHYIIFLSRSRCWWWLNAIGRVLYFLIFENEIHSQMELRGGWEQSQLWYSFAVCVSLVVLCHRYFPCW